MAIFTRFSRLFKADMHAILDQLEEPETLLKQAIREMQSGCMEISEQYQRKQGELDQVERQEKELETSLQTIEEQLDLCFETENQALAKNLVRRKLEQKQSQGVLKKRRQELERQCDALEKHLIENNRKLESMKQKAALYERPVHGDTNVETAMPLVISEEDVAIALLQEQKKRSGNS